MMSFYWTVKVQLESGYKIKICGTAVNSDSAVAAALTICQKDWNQAPESIEIIGIQRGGEVHFTENSKTIKVKKRRGGA